MNIFIVITFSLVVGVVFWSMSNKAKFIERGFDDLKETGFLEGDESVDVSWLIEGIEEYIIEDEVPLFSLQGQGKSFWSWRFFGVDSFQYEDERIDGGLAIWANESDLYISVFFGDHAYVGTVSTAKGIEKLLKSGVEILASNSSNDESGRRRPVVVGPRVFQEEGDDGTWTEVKRGVENLPPPSDVE